MEKPPRAQELNAPILRLARDRGTLADKDLHALLAVEFGVAVSAQPIASIDHMLFSANVNLAKRRLVRYGLLSLDSQRHISITAQGELFLARAFTRLDASVRRCLDDAWRNLETPVEAVSAEDHIVERAEDEEESLLHALLSASNLEFHELGDGAAIVPVWSRLRSWIVDIRESNGWICLRTHVMELPDKPGARMALIDAAMRANTELTSWRFSLGSRSPAIFLEAECSADHLDGDGLVSIIAMLRSTAEQQYEALLKIALAPSPLDVLEAAFKRSA